MATDYSQQVFDPNNLNVLDKRNQQQQQQTNSPFIGGPGGVMLPNPNSTGGVESANIVPPPPGGEFPGGLPPGAVPQPSGQNLSAPDPTMQGFQAPEPTLSGIQAPGDNGSPTLGQAQALGQVGDFGEFSQTALSQAMTDLNPYFQQEESAFRQRMANQGIVEGTEAFDDAYQNFARARNDAYSQAAFDAQRYGLGAQGQAFNQQLQRGQFGEAQRQYDANYGLSADQQDFAQALSRAGFDRGTADALFGQQLAGEGFDRDTANALFGQQFAGSQFDLASDAQGFGQQMDSARLAEAQRLANMGYGAEAAQFMEGQRRFDTGANLQQQLALWDLQRAQNNRESSIAAGANSAWLRNQQFNQQLGENRRQFDLGMGYNYDSLGSGLGLDYARLNEGARQFDVGTGMGYTGMGLDFLNNMGGYGLGLGNQMLGGAQLNAGMDQQQFANIMNILGFLPQQGSQPIDVGGAYGLSANQSNLQNQANVAAHQANMNTLGNLAQAAFYSSRTVKDERGEVDPEDALAAVNRMKTVRWRYKGDGRDHIGPYAEDFNRELNLDDAPGIHLVDAIGALVASVQALTRRVEQLEHV